ncbi:MAG: transcriptional regulator [Synergistaceae bacterium]|nr:transcriptional regulator [Synergistaceae bacterium]
MTLEDIANVVNAKILCGEEKLAEINLPRAYACDLMSDVLALCSPGALLITGLTNIQIVRTAQMLDIPGVLFVRGKTPMRDTISLANESGISLIVTNMSMFQACGILYKEGIKPCLLADMEE